MSTCDDKSHTWRAIIKVDTHNSILGHHCFSCNTTQTTKMRLQALQNDIEAVIQTSASTQMDFNEYSQRQYTTMIKELMNLIKQYVEEDR